MFSCNFSFDYAVKYLWQWEAVRHYRARMRKATCFLHFPRFPLPSEAFSACWSRSKSRPKRRPEQKIRARFSSPTPPTLIGRPRSDLPHWEDIRSWWTWDRAGQSRPRLTRGVDKVLKVVKVPAKMCKFKSLLGEKSSWQLRSFTVGVFKIGIDCRAIHKNGLTFDVPRIIIYN